MSNTPSSGNNSVHAGILAAVGNTPLVRLERYCDRTDVKLFAKLESLNPGGSSKDRAALAILDAGLRSGAIGPDTVIVESSSGNMGIGLAQACSHYGLRFICVVDPKASSFNLKILETYGAQVDMVAAPDPVSGEFLQARLERVQVWLRRVPNSFWPNQYANSENSGAHYRTTMAEIASALAGRVDVLLVATSTCGTIRGCAEYARDHGLGTRIVAVDAAGSVIFDEAPGRRLIPGLGASIRPPLCPTELVDLVVHVTDVDCIAGCRRLLRKEAILAGGSSGGVMSGFDKLQHEIPAGATCVAILPDRGERYLDTLYDDRWVRDHFGEVELDPARAPGAGQVLFDMAESLAGEP
ncbi:MAG: 2,3-diaminopropionate biosynthesis protein SbnA [Acidobacteria bacterium]|nr:2,3-diaminopropionate biosynthesis protein SbnA [Acidobacteriota bacterium]